MREATLPSPPRRADSGPLANRARIRFACQALLATALLLLAVMLTTSRDGRTIFGPGLGADYAGFYTAATILNVYPPDRLYDMELQDRLYHRLLPAMPPHESLPYAHAPFLAFLLRPLAFLPYAWSYATWLVLSASLALAAFGLIRRSAVAIPRDDWETAQLMALTFQPLLLECWLGGQMSVIGFFWVSVALRCERLGRPFAAGAALAVCSYKPTLLVLALPMLALAGRFRTLAGLAAVGLGLAGASLLAVGTSGCLAYVRMLTGYSRIMADGAPGFRVFKHVDINSFFTLLRGGPTPWGRAAVLATALLALPALVATWRASRRSGADGRLLAWSATFSWTAVFNLYTPIYDVSLVLPGVLLTADILYRRLANGEEPLGGGFRTLLTLLVLVPWVTQALARSVGFQPMTLVLLALGGYQMALAWRVESAGPRGWRAEPPTAHRMRRPAHSIPGLPHRP